MAHSDSFIGTVGAGAGTFSGNGSLKRTTAGQAQIFGEVAAIHPRRRTVLSIQPLARLRFS